MIPWIVAGLALAGTVAIYLRLQAAGRDVASRQEAADKLRAALESSRAQLEKANTKARRAAGDVAELRKKLDKSKRRAGPGAAAAGAKGASVTRVQGLESELEQARQARDAAREEAAGLSAELSRVRAEMGSKVTVKPLLDNDAIVALRAGAEADRAQLETLKVELEKSERAREKLKGKSKSQDYLYASMRGELEAKKDRLRQQQEELERLRAFKVAVVDPLPAAEAPDAAQEPPPSVDEPRRPADEVAEAESGSPLEAAESKP